MADDVDPYEDEAVRVQDRRFREACEAGLSIIEARLFAESDQDIGTLRRCVRNGWTPEQIAAVVL